MRVFRPEMAFALALLALLTACENPETPAMQPATGRTSPDCTADGRLTVGAFGAIKADIDWRPPAVRCEGMRRPQGEGVRLRFAGELESAEGSRTLALILSIPDLEQGKTAAELPTRITLIEEENARFFSTREADICWSDVTQHTPARDSTGAVITNHYSISGLTYCVAPVAEVNGTASITLSDMQFTGQVNWAQEEQ